MDPGNVVIFCVFALVIGSFLYRYLRFGGIKAAMFGAEIDRTVGEISGARGKVTNSSVRVHVLRGGPERAVGLEFVTKSVASYQMVPISLSSEAARELALLLQKAIGEA